MNPVLIFGLGAIAVGAITRGRNMLRGGAPAEAVEAEQASPMFAGVGAGGGGGAELGRTVGDYGDDPYPVAAADPYPAFDAPTGDPYPGDAAMDEAPVRQMLPELDDIDDDEPVYSIQPVVEEELVPERPVIANPITGESKSYQPKPAPFVRPIRSRIERKPKPVRRGAVAKASKKPAARRERAQPKKAQVNRFTKRAAQQRKAQPARERKGAKKR